MKSSVTFCAEKKVACVGADEVSSVPFSEFIRFCSGPKKVFSGPDKFGKVNSKPLTDNPDVFE